MIIEWPCISSLPGAFNARFIGTKRSFEKKVFCKKKKKKNQIQIFFGTHSLAPFRFRKNNNKNKHHLQKVFDFLFLAFFSKLSKSKKTRLSLKIIQIWLIHSINQNYSRIVSTRGNTNIHVCSICMHILFSSRNFILKWNIYFQPKMTWKKITRWEKENFSE